MINGSIKERIVKRGKNKNGQMKENLKLYDVYYRYCDPVSGKTHQTTKRGFFTKGEASAFLLKVNVQMMDNNFAPVITITTGEYMKKWFETYVKPNLRPYTVEAYKRNIYNHILPYVGNIELQKLSASNIEALYAKLSESGRRDGKGGLSQKYILHIHRVLTEALEHAAKKRLISRNPAKDISSTPKPKKFKAGTLTSNQVNQVLNTAIEQDNDILIPITLAALCGLRRGEALGLFWSDIDFENRILTVKRQLIDTDGGTIFAEPKSEESMRTVAIPRKAIEILIQFREKQETYKMFFENEYKESDVICGDPDGSVISPSRFSRRFSTFINKHNLPKIRYHDLRHTYASLLLEADVDLKVVSEMLGHSSMAITADIYTHVLDSLKQDASDKLNGLLEA